MGLFSGLMALLGGTTTSKAEGKAEPVAYKGYLIYVEPQDRGGQFGISARITKGEGDAVREHRFLRADTIPSRETCEEITLMKAKVSIDQMGDRLFD